MVQELSSNKEDKGSSMLYPEFWVNDKGEHPECFTTITMEDIKKGIWKTTLPQHQKDAEEYFKLLAYVDKRIFSEKE